MYFCPLKKNVHIQLYKIVLFVPNVNPIKNIRKKYSLPLIL